MRTLLALVLLLSSSVASFALTSNATVISPDSSSVFTPFHLKASAQTCDGVPVAAMGWSIDHSADTTVVTGTSLDDTVTSDTGSHTLHVKSWGPGTACVTDVPISVAALPGVLSGDVQVSTPGPSAVVATPFDLKAQDLSCGGVDVTAMGYSLDSQPNAYTTNSTSLDTSVGALPGQHLLHVKSWGAGGAACVSDVAVDVVSDPATGLVPSNAVKYAGIAQNSNWKGVHDDATPGTASGSMQLVTSPSLSSAARRFAVSFTNSGGERFSDTFGSNTTAHNVLYDGYVLMPSGSSGLQNLELDINQVLSNGDVMIYAFQCAGWTGTWEYGGNSGTVASSHAKWISSGKRCNPNLWKKDTWHHVQIYSSRDDSGNITYHSVWLDGDEVDINKTVPGRFGLSRAQVVQTNFQLDGAGSSGSITEYLDNLNVFMW